MLSKDDIEDMLSAVSSEKKRKRKLAVVIKHLNKGQIDSFGDRITDYGLQEDISTQYYPVIPEFSNLFWGVFIIAFCLLGNTFSKEPFVTIQDFLLGYGLFITLGLYMVIRALYGVKFSRALKNQTYTMLRCTVSNVNEVVSKTSEFDRNSMESTEHTSVSYYAKINGITVKISGSTYWKLRGTNTDDAIALMYGNWIFGVYL